MDIRKFFGVVSSGKKNECEAAKKTEKTKNGEGTSAGKKKRKETKVKNSSNEDDTPKKQTKKKKRIIYDSDSEEETQSVKKSKKLPERKQSSSKPDTVLKQDPVVYISETDEEDDFVKKTCLKLKENGVSARSCQETAGVRKEDAKPQAKSKPLSPVKRTPTSALDYFGTGSVQRSEKILVSSKRKEPSQGRDSTLEDEAIAKILQLEEDAELERQLHEDEEFARTLAMLDETPKEKKARNNPEEKPTTLVTKMSPNTADKHKQSQKVKIANSIDDGVNYSKKEQTKSESMRESCSRPEPSVDKTMNKTLPLKPSSKLVALKQKEENKKKERESLSVARERKTSEKEEKATPKKERVSPQKPESVSPEDSEKKRVNYQAYRSFLNREGPKALGSKEIPQGGENCLEGLTFVITGVLESIERDEAKSLIERYGGKVTGSVSKKTNYLVMGRDCGQSKCDKASALGTKIIDEDGLFDLIQTMPGKKSKYELAAEAEVNKAKSQGERTPQKASAAKRKNSSTKKETDSKKKKSTPGKGGNLKAFKKETPEVRKVLDFTQQAAERKHAAKAEETSISEISTGGTEGLLWVDKYKPTSIKTIIGQQGEQSCANKLLRWLRNWHKNTSEDKHAKPSKFGGRDDGTNFKAALLSGPPGVGKTTTAVLVCEELGYSYVELNASDTRSKNSLKEVVAESLNNTSIKDFCSGTSPSVSTKHVLIMDEVDGMAGNEDRGGIQELIGLIKLTKIPIICMCNDRNHPKIRSLVHYCFDLRFQRPRVEQIKGAMMSVAYKEGLKIPPPAMNEIIMAANQDIRQVLHNLSMWCAKDKSLTYDKAKADSSKAKKDIKVGPFDVVRKVFATGEETAHMSLIDKSDLFFHDYSLAPLFVQENYVHVKPVAAGNNLKKHLMLLSRAADSICDGDLVDTQIRRKQNWSLLPTQAIYASVLPGELMRGYMSQFPNFPSWLGKLSSTGKHERIIQELAMHMSLRTNTCKRTVNMEYLSHLRDAIVRPLTSLGVEGVPNAVTFMDSYCLMKDDVENIMEISSWGGKPSPFSKLDPKVKAAFTRTYNKEAHLTPYALHVVKTSKRRAGSTLTSELNEELNADELQSEEEQDSIENDAMIKQKKAKSSKVSKAEKSEEPKMEGKRKAKMRR